MAFPVGLRASSFLLGAIASVFASGTALAWTKTCDAKRCATVIALQSKEKNTIVRIAVLQVKDTSAETGLLVTTPLGAALEPGVRLRFGAKELRVPFKVCYPDGCQAYLVLTPDTLGLLRSNDQSDLEFFAQSNPNALGIHVELKGLAAAMDSAN